MTSSYKSADGGVILIEMDVGTNTGKHWAEELFEAQAAGLILYGRALGLGHSEAEDAVQDVFTALLQLGDCPRQPAQYLVRSFRNRALNRKRSLWRRLARELESSHWFVPSEAPHPSEARAMDALAQLAEAQREVIVLRFWHGLTFEEIGEVTGANPNTAAGRYRYGMDHLRRRLHLASDADFSPCFNR